MRREFKENYVILKMIYDLALTSAIKLKISVGRD